MKIFIVYWHPEPKSFNKAMFRAAQETLQSQGHEVRTSDLFVMGFDPVSSRNNFTTVKNRTYLKLQLEELHASENNGFFPEIKKEIEKLEWCDMMIWQFPIWWFGLPATLKGWVDRVFVMGRVYGGGKLYENGVFKGKKAMLSLTTGGPEEAYKRGGFNGDIMGVLRPIHRGILQFVGFDVLKPQIVYKPAHMDDSSREKAIEEYKLRLQTITDEKPIEVGEY